MPSGELKRRKGVSKAIELFSPWGRPGPFWMGHELPQTDRLLHRMTFLLFVHRIITEGSHVGCYLELREIRQLELKQRASVRVYYSAEL
jgi:hypothetical protein